MNSKDPANGQRATCGAKTRSGKPCQKSPMVNGRCYFHGGATPKGIASPHYKHGRYSAYLPKNMQADYRAALKDPELMSLRPDVALLDARINECLKDLSKSGDVAANWSALELKFSEFERARITGNSELAARRLVELGELVRDGKAQMSMWKELGSLIEQKRKLAETEARRMERERLVMTIEEGALLVSALASIINKYVTDRQALRLISEDMARILPSGTRVVEGQR